MESVLNPLENQSRTAGVKCYNFHVQHFPVCAAHSSLIEGLCIPFYMGLCFFLIALTVFPLKLTD